MTSPESTTRWWLGAALMVAALGQSRWSHIPAWWDSGFDLLVTPVTLQPAWKLGEDAPIRTGMFCAPFSFTRQPGLVVPILRNENGVPVGVQLVGRHGSDESLLDIGATLQSAVGVSVNDTERAIGTVWTAGTMSPASG